jgi:hypothetical protein
LSYEEKKGKGNATHPGKKYYKPSKLKILHDKNVNCKQEETNSDILI